MNCRLDKLLANNGYGSRKDIKRILKQACLTVNGRVCTDPAFIVDPDTDSFILNGVTLPIRTFVYLMLNKPAGVVTSTDDPGHKTVMDILDPPWSGMELFPVGRLDRDTEGLLIITNDGPLTHRLTSPRTGVDKTYYARLRDSVGDALFKKYTAQFLAGIPFRDGYTCLPAILARADTEENGMYLTIQEGKYHQVKKMFIALGNEVIYLKRISMGSLVLDNTLEMGTYRELTSRELSLLQDSGGET